MFQMTVDRIMRIGNNASIAGTCNNRSLFSGRLKDINGNEYEAYIPLGKDLDLDKSMILLCMDGSVPVESLNGCVLTGI